MSEGRPFCRCVARRRPAAAAVQEVARRSDVESAHADTSVDAFRGCEKSEAPSHVAAASVQPQFGPRAPARAWDEPTSPCDAETRLEMDDEPKIGNTNLESTPSVATKVGLSDLATNTVTVAEYESSSKHSRPKPENSCDSDSGTAGAVCSKQPIAVLQAVSDRNLSTEPVCEHVTAELSRASHDSVPQDAKASYEQRKRDRRSRREKASSSRRSPGSLMDKDGFLSHVPEFEADVQYRFSFSLIGILAEHVAEGACRSTAALRLPFASEQCKSPGSELPQHSQLETFALPDEIEELEEPDAWMSVSRSRSMNKHKEDYRCLCPVPFPWGRCSASDRLKLAKLVFRLRTSTADIATCECRSEASCSAVVFLLSVDVDPEALSQQLEALQCAMHDLRSRHRAGLRPKRAVLLCQEAPALNPCAEAEGGLEEVTLPVGGETWEEPLAEFERRHGALWRFGPVALRDGDGLHAAFAKIASDRIARAEHSDLDSDESGDLVAYEAEKGRHGEAPAPPMESPVRRGIRTLSRISGKAMTRLTSGGISGRAEAPESFAHFPFEEWENPNNLPPTSPA